MKSSLTERQRKILQFLKRYVSRRGYPPTLREIAQNFRIKWTQGIEKHLRALQKKGYIKRSSGARSIEIMGFSQGRSIPVVGTIAGGKPILAEENIEKTFALSKDLLSGKDNYFLKVQGDSMSKAGILDGDYVLVRPQSMAEKGEIVAASIGDEATVKYFFPEKNRVVLKPANSDFKPLVLNEGSDDFRILGKVTLVLRILKEKPSFYKKNRPS
ncbi:repressor LexA [Candidatus Aerophobetes bacterium]|uniref:LexA repressor n=1 Tax=Aerophobetes bacterium TaxID=2030807 RepID=A0A523Y4R3_UNCAE|nr:MAG: repressor LexA [Candidatus Aerophobetes bacterium]